MRHERDTVRRRVTARSRMLALVAGGLIVLVASLAGPAPEAAPRADDEVPLLANNLQSHGESMSRSADDARDGDESGPWLADPILLAAVGLVLLLAIVLTVAIARNDQNGTPASSG